MSSSMESHNGRARVMLWKLKLGLDVGCCSGPGSPGPGGSQVMQGSLPRGEWLRSTAWKKESS